MGILLEKQESQQRSQWHGKAEVVKDEILSNMHSERIPRCLIASLSKEPRLGHLLGEERSSATHPRRAGNVKRIFVHERGGHFAALDAPGLLIDGLRSFFGDAELSGTNVFRSG